MTEINLKKFESWQEQFLPRIRKVYPFVPKRTAAVVEKIGLPPLLHLQSFNSMYIWGEAGTGKTVMAVQYMLGHQAFQFACRAPITSAFIGVTELVMLFRDSHGTHSDETERQILDRYSQIGLLVLDDLGVQNTSDWSYQMLYLLINRRYDGMLPTIITSNFHLEELEESFGDTRITSRLNEMCDVIHNTKYYRNA